MRLPPSTFWSQANRGDRLGVLQGSFNLDQTTNIGSLRNTRLITNATGLSGTPVAFRPYAGAGGTNGIYAIAGSRVYLAPAQKPNSPFVADVQTSTPTTLDSAVSDMEIFNGFLYVSDATNGANVYKLNTTWAAIGGGGQFGGTSSPRLMCVFNSVLYVTVNKRRIYKVSTADSVTTDALVLEEGENITFIRASSNRIWIGVNQSDYRKKRGKVYEWDGIDSNVSRTYILSSSGAFSCVIKDDVPYIMDSEGKLLVLSSSTFKEIARLPFNGAIPANTYNTQTNRYIHPNGMTVIDDRINILVNNVMADSGSSIPEFCPSGIWEYDSDIGLYHKGSPSYTPVNTTTVTDYGQNRVSIVGALSEMKTTDSSAGVNGMILAGATIYTDASATTSSIFYDDTSNLSQHAGYLTTVKIPSANVLDSWEKICWTHKRFLDASDKFVLKYRVLDADSTEYSITWTSTTTFTYTASTIVPKVGNEVEVTQGTGSGVCAHITGIGFSGSTTVSVTIDETVTGATGTAKARVQNWIKLASFSDQTKDYREIGLKKSSPWIQFKLWFLFKGKDELNAIIIDNRTIL
jgi:hypothetical protein